MTILKTNYVYEIYAISAFVLFFMVYHWGKQKNLRIAELWLSNSIKVFESQFEKIGIANENRVVVQLEQESKNQWKFFATGRQNCSYCLVNIETKKRHDFVAMSMLSVYWPQSDRVSYEIPLNFENMPKICFSIMRKKLLANFKTENPEFGALCNTFNIEKVSETCNYITLAENQEFVNHFVDNNIIDFLSPGPKNSKSSKKWSFDAKCLECIHISSERIF